MVMIGVFGLLRRSLPTRGAWIEIREPLLCGTCITSLPTRGAWIEMACGRRVVDIDLRRSPHGERGLKSAAALLHAPAGRSLPTRGAWIEISLRWMISATPASLPTRGAWIEIALLRRFF